MNEARGRPCSQGTRGDHGQSSGPPSASQSHREQPVGFSSPDAHFPPDPQPWGRRCTPGPWGTARSWGADAGVALPREGWECALSCPRRKVLKHISYGSSEGPVGFLTKATAVVKGVHSVCAGLLHPASLACPPRLLPGTTS